VLRPRSIFQLVLIGFGIVTIPLLLAFVVTALFVSDLSHTGQQAIVRAARVVQESRLLVEEADAMERNGRQFLVLEDETVLAVYLRRREALWQALNGLRRLDLTDDQRELLDRLEEQDAELHRRLTAARPAQGEAALDPGEFARLTTLARGVLDESGRLITKNIETLNRSADSVHRLLLWESVALVPSAILLGGVFLLLIIRPLRTLNLAIDRLGSGRFEEPVAISGPRDLQKLGEQLEWLRTRLLELEAHKALFLRNISHELKTPLTTLREGTQLLEEEVVGVLNREQREIAALLSENAIKLQSMIEDLLNFSVSQRTRPTMENEPLDLERLVRRALEEHQLPAQTKRLAITTALVPVTVRGDFMQLKAVFGNLISNAIKFSPPDSGIHISLEKGADWAVFEIEDSGPGIDSADRERVFEAFLRGRVREEGCVRGSGLGLFIAREFVRLHEGTIDVMDSAIGAHLRVRLPASEGAAVPGVAAFGGGARSGSQPDLGLRGLEDNPAGHAPAADPDRGL
jgi:two-component system sensor histidine kinase GlrK